MVSEHHFEGFAAEQAHAVELAAVEEELEEACIVGGNGKVRVIHPERREDAGPEELVTALCDSRKFNRGSVDYSATRVRRCVSGCALRLR